MQNLLAELEQLLKEDERLIADNRLLKNKVIELALKLDETLIGLLLSHYRLRRHFFSEVDSVQVFDKDKFIRFVSNKAFLPDSYTAFANKIGLSDDNGRTYLSSRRDVVLAWPYKDCVLEGGQTAEDAKRHEIFWNETLAPDDIDRLLDPKVLANFRRIDADGEHPVNEIADTDNLIIKGNNLLALHSLLPRFRSRVKLIYIDPPYNRRNERDDFLYNDSFKHSTWLVFMRNRLEVAKELLMTNEGLIWISISDTEAHYLKVLCDEVFGRSSFVADVIWNSTKSVTNTAVISDAHTHNLLYARNIEWLRKNRELFRLEADETKFSNPDNDPRGKWVADPFEVGGIRPNQRYPITNPNTGKVYYPLPGNSWKNEKKVFDKLMEEERIVFGVKGEAGPQRKRFWSEAKERGRVTTTLWRDLPTTTNATKHLKRLFGEKVFENPKPEGLIRRIIQLSTRAGDVVLDFFAGSGTTASAAMKMGRQFIACEQMRYIQPVTVERIKKVVGGEQGGVSKEVNWQGGDSFVYCELMQWNARYIDQIQAAQSIEELQALWETLQAKAFLSYKVDFAQFNEHAEDFAQLSLADQKRFLREVLDKNQLYVNLSEIDDADHQVSDEDKRLNRQFYSTEQN